ncbi:MAG: hypothetical protein QXG00_04925 [Candidatus Woesearchaeota archaeon]
MEKDNLTSIKLTFNNSFYEESEFVYSANFSKKPYYFLELNAIRQNNKIINNLIISNNSIYVKDASNCTLHYYNFFKSEQTSCNINLGDEPERRIQPHHDDKNLYLLLKVLIFLAIIFIIYKTIKFFWGKYLLIIPIIIFLLPGVSAADDCGITNLAGKRLSASRRIRARQKAYFGIFGRYGIRNKH